MACPPPRLCLAASLGLGAFSAAAQTVPAALPLESHTPPALARAVTPPAPPPAPPRSRPISPDLAAALTAAMPAYAPPAAVSGPAAPVAIAPPKNGILRLPDYLVREKPIRQFTERELDTPEGLRAIAMKRYITEFDAVLNAFNIPLFSGYSTAADLGGAPDQRAMRKYEEKEAADRAAEMRDLWLLDRGP
jgi:hypothetical protein